MKKHIDTLRLVADQLEAKELTSHEMPNEGDLLRMRLTLQLSMDKVHEKTGVSKSTISRIERGEEALYSHWRALYIFYCQELKPVKK